MTANSRCIKQIPFVALFICNMHLLCNISELYKNSVLGCFVFVDSHRCRDVIPLDFMLCTFEMCKLDQRCLEAIHAVMESML